MIKFNGNNNGVIKQYQAKEGFDFSADFKDFAIVGELLIGESKDGEKMTAVSIEIITSGINLTKIWKGEEVKESKLLGKQVKLLISESPETKEEAGEIIAKLLKEHYDFTLENNFVSNNTRKILYL